MLSVASADESSRPDLISMMLKQQDSQEGGLPDEEILDEIVMFYVVMCRCKYWEHHDVTSFVSSFQAGHETLTSSLSFVMYMLAQHPDVAARVYEEVVGVCGASGEVTWDHIHELEYTEMVVKETMRLFPVQQDLIVV